MPPRRRRYTNKPKRKSSSQRALPVTLNPEVWLRGSVDIAKYRESVLIDQDFMCAVSGLPLERDGSNSCLDHKHVGSCEKHYQDEGKVRGVLEPQVNLLEGQFLKLYKKSSLYEKYGLSFSELLINMGGYLQKDNSNHPYHKEVMTTYRKQIQRLTKRAIVDKISKDFNKTVDINNKKEVLVQECCFYFVERIEQKERCVAKNQN